MRGQLRRRRRSEWIKGKMLCAVTCTEFEMLVK